MNRLGFLIARSLRREAPLAAMSVPRNELLGDLAGRDVALVGNARSLAEKRLGAAIDAADIVIRINRAPMPAAASHGARTDWLGLATGIPAAELARIRPGRILWMSHKRKRLPWAVAASPGFYLHPLADWASLRDTLGAPPTTGLMLIDMLSQSQAKSVTLYGFDFFASLSLTGSRTAAQVPHNFSAERSHAEALMARDRRFVMADR